MRSPLHCALTHVLVHDLLVVLDLKVTLAVAHEPNLEVALTLVLGKAVLNLKITLPPSTTASRYVSMYPCCLLLYPAAWAAISGTRQKIREKAKFRGFKIGMKKRCGA